MEPRRSAYFDRGSLAKCRVVDSIPWIFIAIVQAVWVMNIGGRHVSAKRRETGTEDCPPEIVRCRSLEHVSLKGVGEIRWR
jgi:hypothetical protein